MKIAFLSNSLGMGGGDRQILYVAGGLVERGHEVRILSITPLGPMGRSAQEQGLHVDSLDIPRGTMDPRIVSSSILHLKAHRPDILVSFMFHANLLGRLVGRIAGDSVIITSLRNERFGGKNREGLLRVTRWLDDMVVPNSELAARKLTERRVITPKRTHVIPNAIVTESYRKASTLRAKVRADHGLGEDHFVWLAVGRLQPQKDYPIMLQAFGRIGSAATLWIAGEGPLKAELKKACDELGVADRVRFLGVRRDIPELLAAADGFVLSSAWEGMPNVVMEAMAAGKPIVATQVGGVPELIQDGKNGILVPPRNPDAFAKAMRNVMELSDAERRLIGEAGQASIAERHDLDAVLDRWETLFRELLVAKGARPQ